MTIPDERHEREQYFFRPPAAVALCRALDGFEYPCVLCAPLVGAEMARRRRTRILDIDDRFASVPGFLRWDVHRPEFIDERFGMIFCDPPFFTVSLSQLFDAIRLLARYDTTTPLAVTYLTRRAGAVESVFGPFGLRPTGYRPEYLTVDNDGRNSIEVFANFDGPLWTRSPAPDAAIPATIGEPS
ncbi:MAG TPA: hypothetical protein VHC70_04260 [Phycisphaerales bacterium]|jgi:hypothetical protein|nr:hypothetical protein [Phycisphaerales bacterium]